MEISLKGKVALVTGASRGIGNAIAATYAGAGASVMLSSRKQDALEAASDEIEGETAVFAAHAGEPDQIEACVAATVERFGRVDILVNNAATNPYMGRPIDIDLPRFDKTWQVNYRGPVVWIQEAWKASMAEHGGSVINISSVGGEMGNIGQVNYTAAKSGLFGLTKTLAKEAALALRVAGTLEKGIGVTVNCVTPGLTHTDMVVTIPPFLLAEMVEQIPVHRMGEPEEIARVVSFLAQDASGYITGQIWDVDGGLNM